MGLLPDVLRVLSLDVSELVILDWVSGDEEDESGTCAGRVKLLLRDSGEMRRDMGEEMVVLSGSIIDASRDRGGDVSSSLLGPYGYSADRTLPAGGETLSRLEAGPLEWSS